MAWYCERVSFLPSGVSADQCAAAVLCANGHGRKSTWRVPPRDAHHTTLAACSWALRGVTMNEFLDGRWDFVVSEGVQGGMRAGDVRCAG